MLSVVIPLAASILYWKKLEGQLKLIFWIVLASALSDAISYILYLFSTANLPVINLFFIVQIILFYLILKTRRTLALQIFFYATVAFAIVDFVFLQTPTTFNSYASYAGALLILVTALVYLYRLLEDLPDEKIQRLPLFWVAFGAMTYYGGTLFLFLFSNYVLAQSLKNHQTIWILHNVVNITKNLFLFIAIWLNHKRQTSS